MNVRLKSLTYNFRGQNRSLEFKEKTLISGKNGIGKSTVLNALLWLLSGYDLSDIQNNNLFDNTTPNDPQSPKTVTVTGEFEINGNPLKLSKTAKQIYARKRGKEDYERSNDKYFYYIDDLEVPAGEYSKMVEEYFGSGEKLRLMLNTNFWEMLDWRVLRSHLMSIVGNIDDKEFVNADYTPLFPLLHTTTPDGKPREVDPNDLRKTFMNRLKDLKESKTKLDTLITDKANNLPDVSQVAEWEAKVEELKAERESIDAHLLGLGKVNEEYVAIRKAEEDRILEAENAYRRLKLKYEDEQRERLREAQQKLDDALANNRRLDSEEARLKRDIENCENNIKRYELLRGEKLKEMEQIDLRKFDGNCPHCGASLVGANRADAIARFKEKQSTDKQLCLTQGQKIRKDLDYEKERKSTLEADSANLKRIDTKPLREELAKIQEESQRPFESTESAKNLQSEIETLKANRTEIQPNPDIEKGQIRKGEIDTELSELYKSLGVKQQREKAEGELAELKAQLKQNVDATLENEKLKSLVETYINEQSQVISTRANRYFDDVRVIMQRENKSGVLEPCCKLEINDVTDTMNTASRTRIGFEVSRAFQRYYDRVLPLFLDRAESLNENNVPQPDGQLVLLKVTEGEFKVENV